MKKTASVLILIALIISLTSCGSILKKLEGEYSGYYLEKSLGIYGDEFDSISITNYYPYEFAGFPNYQELVQYGYVGIENEGVVYLIYIVDTSIDSNDAKAYYCAEFDGETRELLFEEGMYFADKAAQDETVDRLLDMIDSLKDEYLAR